MLCPVLHVRALNGCVDGRRPGAERKGLLWLMIAASVVLVGCGDDDHDAAETSPPPGEVLGCDPARPFDAGEYDRLNVLGELEQPYWVVVPESYTGTEALPLLVILPGGTGDRDAALTAFRPGLGDRHGVVAIPRLRYDRTRSVAMFESLLDNVSTEFCVDPSLIGVMGSSSSALTTGEVASASSHRVATVVVGLGRFSPKEGASPVPILAWTGDDDRSTTRSSVELWAEVNGCDPEPVVTDLGSGISHVHYEGCDAPLELYDIDGMGHQIPSHDCSPMDPLYAQYCADYEEFDLLDAAADFITANPLR